MQAKSTRVSDSRAARRGVVASNGHASAHCMLFAVTIVGFTINDLAADDDRPSLNVLHRPAPAMELHDPSKDKLGSACRQLEQRATEASDPRPELCLQIRVNGRLQSKKVRHATLNALRGHSLSFDTQEDARLDWLEVWGAYDRLAKAPNPDFDLRSIPELRGLVIGEHHAVEAEFRHIGQLQQLRELTFGSLDFDCQMQGAWLRHLSGLQQLESLTINSQGLTDESLTHLLKLKELRHVQLSNYIGFGDAAIGTLTQLPELGFLGITGEFSDHSAARLARHPKLRVLELHGPVTDSFLEVLSASSSLEDLHAGGSQATDVGVQKIAARGNWKRLSIWSSQITDQSLPFIASNRKLVQLELCSTNITDACLAWITRLEHLEMLRLRRSSITDEGIQTLSRCPRLKRLFLHGCERLTDECAAALEGFPNLEVVVLSYSGVSQPVRRRIYARVQNSRVRNDEERK